MIRCILKKILGNKSLRNNSVGNNTFRNNAFRKDQRGGIAILTALGFLLFSIPLITASLDLAQNTAIDARVKTDITTRQ